MLNLNFPPIYLISLLVILIILNLILIFWLFKLTRHYNQLINHSSSGKKSLITTFTQIQKTLAAHEKKLTHHRQVLDELKFKLRQPLQKVLFKRFNPFSHTGGNQSFMLALLDEDNNGILLTSLHSRENTRFYVKLIKDGEGVNYPLSQEEHSLLKQRRSSHAKA